MRELGHRASIAGSYRGEPCDVLLALHARKSAEAVFDSRAADPVRPVVLALTGTDVYGDIRTSATARRALEAADRLVVLQPLALEQLPAHLRERGRVIRQSAEPVRPQPAANARAFAVTVAGHLRAVKDPFRAAYASRLLPASSQVRIVHLGAAREASMEEKARSEERRNLRYRWLGQVAARTARRTIAASRLLVLSSRMEGGANVISEAIVDRVPVLASRIPGSVGLLGPDYPGYFEVGDTTTLAGLLARAETDRAFYACLKAACARLAPLFAPARERAAWKRLLRELC